MGYVDCPNCARRLRVPDVPGAVKLRCPACKHAFQRPQAAVVGAPTNVLEGDDDGALDESYVSSADTVVGDPLGISDADFAGMDRFGVGSGLLELTNDSTETSLGAPLNLGRAAPVAEKAGSAKQPPGAAAAREQARQQIQMVRTALKLARKLESKSEAELLRTRRLILGGAIAIGVLGLASLGLLWWGTTEAGMYRTERATTASLSERLSESGRLLQQEQQRAAAMAAGADAARSELREVQDKKDAMGEQLMTARELLAAREAEADVLGGELDKARSEAATLTGEVALLREKVARAEAATQPAAEATAGRGQ